MADDRHYVGGEWYRICERTGFKIRAPRTRKEWTNRIVREQSYEARQPQDFVQGIPDDQTVVDPRPRQIDVFQGPLGTVLTNSPPAGTTFLILQTDIRMSITDRLSIILDNHDTFFCTVADILTPNMIQISPPLPFKASAGNVVIDLSAVAIPIVAPLAPSPIPTPPVPPTPPPPPPFRPELNFSIEGNSQNLVLV